MRGQKLLLLLGLVSIGTMVKANHGKDGRSEPTVHGIVSDAATKKPVQGVTVSITSPKFSGNKEFTTDASGSFKISQLPPGEVTIVLEKKGYKTYRREGVVLKEGMNIRLNLDLREESEDEVFHPLLRMMEGG